MNSLQRREPAAARIHKHTRTSRQNATLLRSAPDMPLDWQHAEFRFRSPRDWDQIAADASHVQLLCREARTTLTLSIVACENPPETQESAGRLLMEERRKAHLEAVTRVRPNGLAPDLRYDYERLQPHQSGNGFE